MRALLVPLAIAGVLPYLFTAIAKAGAFTRADNARTRAWAEGLTGWRQRAYWAQLNSFEGYPLFAAAVLAVAVTSPTATLGAVLAWGYVAARLGYGACYLLDQASARSVVWMAGLGCCVGLFGVAVTAA